MNSWKNSFQAPNKKKLWSKSKKRWLSDEEGDELIKLLREKQEKIKQALEDETPVDRDIRLGFEDHLKEVNVK